MAKKEYAEGILTASCGAAFRQGLRTAATFPMGDVQCSVRVFERCSVLGGNRLSRSVTLFGKDGDVHLSAITAGGSTAMFFKLNTFGEEAFLEKLKELL